MMERMVHLVAGLTMLTGVSDAKAGSMAWVQRLRYEADRDGSVFDPFALQTCVEACDAVRRKFGADKRLDRWQALSLASLGKYRESARFRNGLTAKESALVAAKADAKRLYQNLLGHRIQAISVVPIDAERKTWIGVSGRWDSSNMSTEGIYLTCRLDWFRTDGAPKLHRFDGVDFEDGYMWTAMMKPLRLDAKTPAWVVKLDSHGADNNTHQLLVITMREGKPRIEKVFRGQGDSHWGRTGDGRAYVSIEATWKIWWPDVYDWNGKKFVFANKRHPEEYRNLAQKADLKEDWSYAQPLKVGIASLIRGDRQHALNYLSQAETWCEMTLKQQRSPKDKGLERYYVTFWGDNNIGLEEIRRRIKWLKAGDLDHDLLYRPYDWDLQVPPFKLGKNRQDL